MCPRVVSFAVGVPGPLPSLVGTGSGISVLTVVLAWCEWAVSDTFPPISVSLWGQRGSGTDGWFYHFSSCIWSQAPCFSAPLVQRVGALLEKMSQ